MKLEVSKIDILKHLKGLVHSFSSLAERKKVSLKVKTKNNSIVGFADCDKLDKIISNLLSNAFKFTPEGGEIEVAVLQLHSPQFPLDRGEKHVSPLEKGDKRGCLEITISNTGPGIPPEQIDKIFDRFYQADDNFKKDGEGTGIGLALIKELVEVCRGEISVESEKYVEKIPNLHPSESPPVGGSDYRRDPLKKGDFKTTFTIWLPIAKESFKEDEIIDTPVEEIDSPLTKGAWEMFESFDNIAEVKGQESISKIPSPVSTPLLLIVEDNPDVTNYISSFMDNDYRIITAENGKVGLKKTLDKFPDLVISDVMMPGMDGFELCNKLKSDQQTSHIPVILLTAKADLGSKIEGLEFGADDYISKPFEARELQVRASNLIELRRKLREKFASAIEINPGEITSTSMDEQFLKRLLDVFENHYAESNFSSNDFAREIGISRAKLYRKIQALTNQSVNDFLRSLRLKRAAQMLRKGAGTVSEIAYAVGFNSPSHFSKIFRQQFGQSPRNFAGQNQ